MTDILLIIAAIGGVLLVLLLAYFAIAALFVSRGLKKAKELTESFPIDPVHSNFDQADRLTPTERAFLRGNYPSPYDHKGQL